MLKTLLITTTISGVVISGAIAQSQTPSTPAPTEQSAAPKDQSTAKESASASEASAPNQATRRVGRKIPPHGGAEPPAAGRCRLL
jgi:hypothetical protein